MTDYTELIRSLKACEHDECYPERCDWFGKYQVDLRCKNILLANAAAAIEELQAEIRESMQKCAECSKWNEPHWVSVEDELPDNKMWVLVWHTGYQTAKKAKFIRDVAPEFIFDGGGGAWQLDGWSDNEGHVTHWMPLPEPPQEVQDGE